LVNHLVFVQAATTNNHIQIAPNWSIEFDEIFEISILGLAEDVVKSVYKDDGYLQLLEKDNSLQAHFEQAIENMHSLIQIKTKSDGTQKCKQTNKPLD
jgi:hypothetical protein